MTGALVSLVTFSIGAPPLSAKVTEDAPRFTVSAATYNVCKVTCGGGPGWSVRRDRVARTINEAAPELLAVQEAPTLRYRDTTQWADLTARLSQIGYRSTSTIDECSQDCTRGAHLYFDPEALRLNAMAEAAGMTSQRRISGMSWGPIQDRNVSWAYLQDITTGGAFLAISVHLPNEKTPLGEDVRQAVARNLPGWIKGLNAQHGMSGIPTLVMGDFNSFNTRQPRGGQWILEQAGYRDAFDAEQRINARIGTVNYTPATRRYDGFPPRPYRYSRDASRIDYIFCSRGIDPLVHEVVVHLRGDEFDPAYHGSDHNMVRTVLSVPVVAG